MLYSHAGILSHIFSSCSHFYVYSDFYGKWSQYWFGVNDALINCGGLSDVSDLVAEEMSFGLLKMVTKGDVLFKAI